MLGMLQPPQARPRATTAIFPGRNLIVLAGSVPESGFSRPGFSALRAEDEALRVLAQGVEHPVERARVALELLDQRVEARQGLVVERVRGDADFVQARRHPLEGPRTLLQLARQLAEIGWRRAWTKRSEEHTSELQSHSEFVCRLLLEKKKKHDSQRHHGPATPR